MSFPLKFRAFNKSSRHLILLLFRKAMNWRFQFCSLSLEHTVWNILWSFLHLGFAHEVSPGCDALFSFLQLAKSSLPFRTHFRHHPLLEVLFGLPGWTQYPSSSFPLYSIPLSYPLASDHWNYLLWVSPPTPPPSLEFHVLMGGTRLYSAFSPPGLVKSSINVIGDKFNGQKLVSNKV